jgi:hypothetical protein
VNVWSPIPRCQTRLGCPLKLGTLLNGTGAFTGQVTYSWGTSSCIAPEQNASSGQSFVCDLTIDTVGPHQITAHFVGSNGFANTSCTTTFEADKRSSFAQVLATPLQPYVIGAPNYLISATVAAANTGELQLVDNSSQPVASGPMGSNGSAVMTTNPRFLGMFFAQALPSVRLLNDPNTQIGLFNAQTVPLSMSAIPDGIVWTPQHVIGALEYDAITQQISAHFDLQLPATTFAAQAGLFSVIVDGSHLLASSVTTNGQRRTHVVPASGIWLGRHRISISYDPIVLTVLDSAPQLEINTGGFE